MLHALVSTASQLLNSLNRTLLRERGPTASHIREQAGATPRKFRPLKRLLLTDGVGRTLFEEYACHRAAERGEEETGWMLLGLRREDEAVVLATLPAGAEREASASHIRFNSDGQALGSRIVRQADRRLTILGVVHTHPGTLRHPSDGDFRGDREWVEHLRGEEGIFGIGTADARAADPLFAQQPRPHVQCLGESRFSWYSLRAGASGYHPLPVGLTLGPDLARPLHVLWPVVEAHAERLDRLCRQQAGITFEVIPHERHPGLVVNIPLCEPEASLRVLLKEKEVRYYLVRGGELLEAACLEERVDRGVYLLLAELADQSS